MSGSAHVSVCTRLALVDSHIAERAPGAATRRRLRQLRAFHRHERLTVWVELATAFHHSAQPAGPVVEGPRKVEAHETNNALRRPKEPPPETRPGVLKDPELQARDAATSYVVAGAPPLAALPSGEHGGLDAATMSFFVQCAMLEQDLPEVQVVERPPRSPWAVQVEAIPKILWLVEHLEVDHDGNEELSSHRSRLDCSAINREWVERGTGVAKLLVHRQTGWVQFEMSQERTGMIVGFSTFDHTSSCRPTLTDDQ